MIWDIISGLFGGLWGYVATAAGGVLIVGVAWLKGRASARNKARMQKAEEHIETRKDVEDAIATSRGAGTDWRERLRKLRRK